ncbi:MAG: hypothetical protein WCF94_02260 [bacterium]
MIFFIFVSLNIILVLLFLVYLFIFGLKVYDLLMTDVPFVPTKDIAVAEAIKLLDLNNNSVLYDLGCGNAKVLLEAKRLFPQIKAVGIEKGLIPFFFARWATRKTNIKIVYQNIFKTDLAKATHIYCYLYPKVIARLMPIMEKQCAKGTMIVTCDYPFVGKTSEKIVKVEHDGKLSRNLFLYRI